MARDYKRTNQAKKKKASGSGRTLPGWVWGASGLTIGLFVALLVHLDHQNPDGPESIRGFLEKTAQERGNDGGDRARRPEERPAEKEEGRDGPTFEFYKLLPEQEVVVPDAEPEPEKQAPRPQQEPATAAVEPAPEPEAEPEPEPETQKPQPKPDGTHYLLQAGSFRSHGDADRLKAELALLGVEAHIQTVTLEGGETWHRVRVGPYNDQGEINNVRSRLQSNGVETILLKRKG